MQRYLVTHEASEWEVCNQLAIKGEAIADVIKGEDIAKDYASQFYGATVEPITEIEAGIFQVA